MQSRSKLFPTLHLVLTAGLSMGLLCVLPLAAHAQGNTGAVAQDAPGQPFVISALPGQWIVEGEFKGHMSVKMPSIELSFDKTRLSLRNGVPATMKRRVVRITPCLATATKEASSALVRRGTSIKVGRDLAVGQECEVDAFTSSIALDDTVNLPQHWLVIEIELERTNPDGTTGPSFLFIQSDHSIFTPKP